MSLQHSNTVTEENEKAPAKARKPYGVVAVACGEGLKDTFRERGADVIVDGGQSMNPSAEDLIDAFDEVNAEVIFVFPNNGNIISQYDFCILIRGKDAAEEEAERIEDYIYSRYRGKEVYTISGGQDVYDYILIVE